MDHPTLLYYQCHRIHTAGHVVYTYNKRCWAVGWSAWIESQWEKELCFGFVVDKKTKQYCQVHKRECDVWVGVKRLDAVKVIAYSMWGHTAAYSGRLSDSPAKQI